MPLLLCLLLALGSPFTGLYPVAYSRPSLVVAPGPGLGPAAGPGAGPAARPGRVVPLVVAPVGAFGWPVDPPHVVRLFDPPAQPWLAGHRGADLAAVPLSAVHAAGAGTVVYAGRLADRGVVSLAHAGGLRTTYEPVTSALRVGDRVTAGQLIGTLEQGHPGCPAPACLHWGLRSGARYFDPLALLGLGRVRLLPLDGGSG